MAYLLFVFSAFGIIAALFTVVVLLLYWEERRRMKCYRRNQCAQRIINAVHLVLQISPDAIQPLLNPSHSLVAAVKRLVRFFDSHEVREHGAGDPAWTPWYFKGCNEIWRMMSEINALLLALASHLGVDEAQMRQSLPDIWLKWRECVHLLEPPPPDEEDPFGELLLKMRSRSST